MLFLNNNDGDYYEYNYFMHQRGKTGRLKNDVVKYMRAYIHPSDHVGVYAEIRID